MITIQESLEINRSVGEVFDYAVNVENAQKWQPAVIEVQRLTEGPIRVGTKFREVAKMMGRRISTTCEITELEMNKKIAFKGTSSGPIEYETSYAFEPHGDRTLIRIHGTFRTKGFWKFLEPFFKGEVMKESREEILGMKKFIESRSH